MHQLPGRETNRRENGNNRLSISRDIGKVSNSPPFIPDSAVFFKKAPVQCVRMEGGQIIILEEDSLPELPDKDYAACYYARSF